jgi:single-strand DNA-binding protein
MEGGVMTSKGLTVTVVGWAATTPKEVSGDGVPFTSFRLATTPRYFDNRQGAWTDGRTEWLTVKVFRDVALNVAASVHKGDPVLVHGRMKTEEWVGEQGPRFGLVMEAAALGHDLTRGRSNFARTVHVGAGAHAGDDATAEGTGADAAGAGDAAETVDDPWAPADPGATGDDSPAGLTGHSGAEPALATP